MRITALLPLLTSVALCAGTPATADAPPGPSSSTTLHRLHRRLDEPEVKPEYTLQFREGIRNSTAAHEHMDLITWSTDATSECLKTLSPADTATNPAGIAICYNIPAVFLDESEESTRLFAVDMRLFQINDAKGDWAELDDKGISLDIKYPTHIATAPRNATSPEKSAANEALDGFYKSSPDSDIKLVEALPWIGTIGDSIADKRPNDDELKKLLTPNITILGRTKDGKDLKVPVSIKDTSFLLGVFSPDRPAPVAPPPEPFQMPGMSIEITPVGLFMYAAYTVVACGIFGYGTFERARFRKQYRTRMAQMGGR